MEKRTTGHRFALSLSQKNIWDLERLLPGTSVNNISTTIRIRGRVDFMLLQESILLVLKSDASMRTRIVMENGTPMQVHEPFEDEVFPVFDFSHTGGQGLESWEAAMTREAIPLTGGPLYRFVLFRTGENEGGVLVKLHHIISDGWSQVMICNRIGQTYLDLLAGKEPELSEAPDYELHVEEEQEYLASAAYKKDERYWKKVLEKAGEPSVLKNINSAAISPVGRRKSFDLPQVLNHAIYSFCMEKRVAPFAVFYMALAIYFKRIGGAERFTIGVPIFNRTNFQFKQSTGMFVTTLPFYNTINEEWTFNQFNEELFEAWFELLRHQRFPFSHIERLAAEETGRQGRLFHIALSYQDSKIVESRDASVALSGRWHYSGYQSEQLCIHLTNLWNNKCYSVDYDYLTQFFTEEEIGRLHESLCNILMEALSEPDKPIYRLNVLTDEEREKVLYTFNRTERYLENRSVYEALETASSEYLSRAALICRGMRVTYAELLWRGAEISGAIKRELMEREDREAVDLAAIFLPRGVELFASMVGSLQAGLGYLILSPELPQGRIEKILKQSGAGLVLTDREGKERLAGMTGLPSALAVEDIRGGTMGFHLAAGLSAREEGGKESDPGSRLAYVVYTSGSTGEPKGVEITQRNLLNLARAMAPVYGRDAVLSVCNIGFDAFVLESISALLNGRTVVLPADSQLESPRELAGLIWSYAVGYFSMTPSRLSAFLKDREFCGAMRRMESIVCGGEAFPADLLKKLKHVSHARIYNQYGPSETTVGVSIGELSDAARITAGRPMDNCRLYVLDNWMNPLPVGVFGSLYVGGYPVGRGYRNGKELTEKSFLPNPFENGDRLYATGDAACWTETGEIVLAGRLDSQVKLRGLRVEPGEVAACIASYPGVLSAAAQVCQINGQPVLAAYYCADGQIPEAELLAFAATYLPSYMIPACVMRLPELPMNGNGKVDESRLPLPGIKKTGSGAGKPVSRLAEEITEIFRRVLPQASISADSDYFLCGGNSLNAMEAIALMETDFGRRLRVADIYACRTAARLAAYLEGDREAAPCGESGCPSESFVRPAIKKAPDLPRYPLSPMQQGIYVQSWLDKSGLSYNMPGAFRLSEKPDMARLEAAFEQVIAADAVFRSSFVQEKDGIFIHIDQQVPFAVETLSGNTFEEASEAFVRPFDLGRAPLLRAAVWESEQGEWFLLLDSHHIIGDGLSTPLVLKRINDAYMGKGECVPFSYHDYTYSVLDGEQPGKREDEEYWKEQFKDIPEPLVLPGDFARTKSFDFRGKEYEVRLTEKESRDIDEFCRARKLSGFTVFLAAYGILLSRISGRRDFMIGAPVAGRLLPEAMDICGPFINTLPLRLMPGDEKTVDQWLSELQGAVAGMLDHQQISLEELITLLHLPRGEQNPFYQVMLTESPVDEGAFLLGGCPMEFCPISTGSVKMDMILEIARKKDAYALRFSYATGVFLEETIGFYGRCLKQLLKQLTSGKECRLSGLSVLSPEDEETYVEAPNYTVTPFMNLPIHKMIEKRGKTAPAAPAVIFHGKTVSMEELEKRACGLAAFLAEKGIGAGRIVGLCLSRTPELLAAMYAVLKAGGAYVPMLPSFPEERLSYMLEISEASLVLCDGAAMEKLPDGFAERCSCPLYLLPDCTAESFETVPVSGDGLVDVVFTSGSTGRPKGVMLSHRSVSNLFAQMKALLDPIPGTVLCSTNSIFDCFIVETMIALALGRTVVLADEEEMLLPWKLAKLVSDYETGIFEMTPSRLQMCLGNEAFRKAASHIKIVLLGGEVLTPALLNSFYSCSDGALTNMYGPTEATVFTTMTEVRPGDPITVGRPLFNTRTYVLDENRRPVMPTACGELYIAGECLAGGYISRPELTEASFVPDLYFPGEKMYKSGDLVRLRVNGTYDFIGRADSQVKFNGQRVELSEITSAIMDTGLVSQAATVAVKKENGSMELCSFYESGAGEETNTAEKLTEKLRLVLPAYMIPSRILALEKMPMTATNKIDMQSLIKLALEGEPSGGSTAAVRKEAAAASEETAVREETVVEEGTAVPEAAAGKGEASAPLRIDADFVLGIWNQVLLRPVHDPNVSFFEQGGTSLAALSVLSSYFNYKLEMSLAEFYQNPTANAQAALLSGAGSQPEDVSQAPKLILQSEKAQKTYILVTGGTGFFGAHLIKELLDRGEEKLLCLMRDGSEERLLDSLAWYFGRGFLQQGKKRISAVKGDITKDNLGLSREEYGELAGSVREIFHCAADVRHYAADKDAFLAANVAGTEHMLSLAKAAGAKFYHMSTLSVSGEYLKNGGSSAVFTERDYDIGQIWEDNLYVNSKFCAEGLVREASEGGLAVKIFRLGRLVGRASDGVFQRNPETNAFYLLLRAFRAVGAIPETAAKAPVDLMPIDCAAAEVLALVYDRREADEDGLEVFHIMNQDPPTAEAAAKAVDECLYTVPDEVFSQMLLETARGPFRELVAPLIDYWHHIRTRTPVIEVSNEITIKELEHAGFYPRIPGPERLLGSFSALESWPGRGE